MTATTAANGSQALCCFANVAMIGFANTNETAPHVDDRHPLSPTAYGIHVQAANESWSSNAHSSTGIDENDWENLLNCFKLLNELTLCCILPASMLRLHKRMVQISHRNVILGIHRTFDRPIRMVSLRPAYRCHRAAIAQIVPIWQQCSFVDSKMQRDQHPVIEWKENKSHTKFSQSFENEVFAFVSKQNSL